LLHAASVGDIGARAWELNTLFWHVTTLGGIGGTPTVLVTAGTASSWNVTVGLDATNDALEIKAYGASGVDINWQATIIGSILEGGYDNAS